MTTAIDKNIDSSSPVYSIFVRLKGHLDEDVSDTMRDLLDALNYSEMEELTELIPQFAEFMSEYVHITVLCNIPKDGNLLRMAAKYGKYLADTLGSDEVREQAMQDALSADEQQLIHKTEVIKKDFPLEEDELNRLTALLTDARFAY